MKQRRGSAEHREPSGVLGVCGALALACCACAPSARGQHSRSDGVEHCSYEVAVLSERPLQLEVQASCRGVGIRGLEANSPDAARVVSAMRSGETRIERHASTFRLPTPRKRVTFTYQVDLDALAARSESYDLALRSGRSLIAPASSFLLHPLPLDVGTEVEVRVRTPPGLAFSTGMRALGDHYVIEAHELTVATYSVFGPRERRTLPLDGGESELELAVLDGPLDVDMDVLARWVQRSAQAVSAFYGRFPARRTFVAIAPVPNRSAVLFGKLLPESAPGVVLLLGSGASERDLYDDWVLVHELFHIGVPSFYGEGKWFDEGLATYYEPIVRVRARLLDEHELWRDFLREMPAGLPALTEDGLEHVRDYRGMYWGGAVYCLMADVAARRASNGALGLEDGLRRVLAAGGQASDVWGLGRTLATADAALGTPILAPLAERYAQTPAPFDLAALFEALGVEASAEGVVLHDDAPLSWVRKALLDPPTPRAKQAPVTR